MAVQVVWMSVEIDRQRSEGLRVYAAMGNTHDSNAIIMAAWTRVTATKAQVHVEFGLYMMELCAKPPPAVFGGKPRGSW